MKQSYMKQIKKCFGDAKIFYTKSSCYNCQFKRKCLLKTKGRLKDEE